ncbi:DNA repair protein RecN [Anaerotalea alkaliphila]|uniref:DNA repair protein RecN n=1 Tax=Anaerotalea alkaliphila TaxID=2662126 RepID=A0A7X5HTH9_9FIRM|nr:DNA repair protein RecN [Anaerotalea alkaliphila]NDL66265.1 DNA repair protein RecN [Anaerotalea alkaliphila]
MLTYLHVKNIALIEEMEVDFAPGLNIMTGETGAGKSIIIGSMDAVLGGKASKESIGSYGEEALLELVFKTRSQALSQLLESLEIPFDGELVVTRKMHRNGRSVFRVNGEMLSQKPVRRIAEQIVDIHSQQEHQSLLDKGNHIRLLDRFLGAEGAGPLAAMEEAYRELQKLQKSVDLEMLDDEKRKREISFLAFEISELEEAALTPGEDKRLEERHRFVGHVQKIRESLSQASRLLLDGSLCQENLVQAMKQLEQVRGYAPEVENLARSLGEIDGLLTDFGRELHHYLDGVEVDEQELHALETRIDLVNLMKTKYGNTLEQILENLEEKKAAYEKLLHFEENLMATRKAIKAAEGRCRSIGEELSALRRQGAKRLAAEIGEALSSLNFKHAQFQVAIRKRPELGRLGVDDVEFMVSLNQGEDPKPLVKVASGGEVSRIMLALKSILAVCDEIETLVFDEIDIGISGMTAQKVGEKMKGLSKARQILCITHLPQIAAFADAHYVIEKESSQGKTTTRMRLLDAEEEVLEVGRMLSGPEITPAVLENAREMKGRTKRRRP